MSTEFWFSKKLIRTDPLAVVITRVFPDTALNEEVWSPELFIAIWVIELVVPLLNLRLLNPGSAMVVNGL